MPTPNTDPTQDPSSDLSRTESIFHEARVLSDQARADYLGRTCGADADLRRRVEALLASDSAAEGFLSESDITIAGDHHAEIRETAGSKIGPYKLLQLIGEGGFGSVFMAEQDVPVKRRVALKIIKLGMDTRQIVARFEQERQALAVMDHTNIAKVFDAGTTESGRPYFVMELCRGEAITDYADKQNLNIRQRLELFAQVCAAVQHAHTKGIIHRDIKPSNVLVATQDGRPHVKVIDFGIAKATANKLTEKTLFTQFSQMIGTPQYMSPEQAEGSFDIDTRTDVYALGVMLYELLTGVTPFDPKSLRGAAYKEIERIIREVEPPAPSSRLSQNTDTIASVAAQRKTEPRKLNTIVRGELDWIVMKALEKDRHRRYETANGLASDIQRYLTGEAVLAAPPSTAYRVRKFVRRNRSLVTGITAVAAALLIGIIAFGWQAKIARRERDRAQVAEHDAKLRADELSKVSEFQSKMLSQIDTADTGMKLMTDIRDRFSASLEKNGVAPAARPARIEQFARDLAGVNATDTAVAMIDQTILKPAITAIDAQFKDQPVVAASLRHTLGNIYQILGLYDDAIKLHTSAISTFRSTLGDSNVQTLDAVNSYGYVREAQGKFAEAEKCYREVLDGYTRTLGSDDAMTAVASRNLANLLSNQGKFDQAEPLLRSALQTLRRTRGDDDRQTLIAINSVGFVLASRGKLAEAEPLWREAYDRGRRVLGENDADLLVWENNLASLIQMQGRFKEAEPLFRDSLDRYRHIRGEAHPDTIRSICVLALNVRRQSRGGEAESLYRDAVDKSTRSLGPLDPITIDSQRGLGSSLMQERQYSEAEPIMREALASTRKVFGEDHPTTIDCEGQLALLLSYEMKFPEAETAYHNLISKASRVLGPEHPQTLVVMINMGTMLANDEGKLDEAEPIIRKALELRRRISGDSHPETLVAMNSYARLREKQGNLVEAESNYRDALEKFRKVLGNEHRNTQIAMVNLAKVLGDQKKFAEAELLFLEAELAESLPTSTAAGEHKSTVEMLSKLYESWDKAEPGKGYDVKATQWRSKLEQAKSATSSAN